MAATEYGYLIKQLTYEPATPGSTGVTTIRRGADLEGVNVSFSHGFRRETGTWTGDGGITHVHPYNEVLLFAGLDPEQPNSLGAEINITLGDTVYTVDRPAVVVLPAGVPHGPLATKQTARPFGFLAISCSGEHKTAETAPAAPDGGCDHLVQPYQMRYLKRENSGNADHMTGWSGESTPGFNLNFTWAFHSGVGPFHTHDPHVHPNDECLVFLGTDPERPAYLGAEISIGMGEETHVFDRPTVVIAPAGLVHCPLVVRRVERPYHFTAICLSNSHDTTWLGGDPNEPNLYALPPRRQ